jgi:hypothetical protein
VFPRLVQMAETDFNRRLRCREQITETNVTVSGGSVGAPANFAEALGLYSGTGREMTQLSRQSFERLYDDTGFWALDGSNIIAADAEYLLVYYAKIPTLTTSNTTTNWLLEKHPELYLYAVAEKAAKYLTNVELATATGSLAETEYNSVAAQDHAERYARARVRVGGPTP